MEPKSKKSESQTIMKVVELKTYQPVRFMNDLETHFTARRQKFAGIIITFDTEKQLIVLEIPGKDKKIIFPTNVEYLQVE